VTRALIAAAAFAVGVVAVLTGVARWAELAEQSRADVRVVR
jgi:hypothetical protein